MRSWVCAGYAPPTDARQGSRTQNLGPTRKQRWCPPPFISKICAGGMRSAPANEKTLFSWVCAGVCAPRRPMDYRLSSALGGMRSAPANKKTLFSYHQGDSLLEPLVRGPEGKDCRGGKNEPRGFIFPEEGNPRPKRGHVISCTPLVLNGRKKNGDIGTVPLSAVHPLLR